MVGQEVTGVVEATLDAGYLLSVRIGDSNTYLRGIVFKPGHYVPVTADNDVAPHVPNVDVQRDAPPAKRKYARRKNAASARPVGEGSSSAAPVVSSSGGLQISEHGVEEEVHVDEPSSTLSHVRSIPRSEGAEVGEEEKTK